MFQEELQKLAGATTQEDITEPEHHTERALDDHSYAQKTVALGPTAFVTHLRTEKNIKPTSLSEAVPGSYASALNNPFAQQWIAAIDDELEAHQDNGTWTIVPRPPKIKTILAIWKFSVKCPDGQEKAKARLVAFGCADTNRYSIDETYAPVCRVEAIRLALAIAVRKRLKLLTIDVTTAFLCGTIKEDIYLSIPDGIDIDRKKFVLKLNKSLYGLRTSSRIWTDLLQQKLFSLGFSETPKKCVYQRKYGKKLTLLLTYVDDILIVCRRHTHRRKRRPFRALHNFGAPFFLPDSCKLQPHELHWAGFPVDRSRPIHQPEKLHRSTVERHTYATEQNLFNVDRIWFENREGTIPKRR